MIKITILIPVTYNDKIPVSLKKLGEYVHNIEKIAHGCTVDGKVHGSFIDDNEVYSDNELIKVWIIGGDKLLNPIRDIARRIAIDLRQESVYLEWHDVNVEFIEPPKE